MKNQVWLNLPVKSKNIPDNFTNELGLRVNEKRNNDDQLATFLYKTFEKIFRVESAVLSRGKEVSYDIGQEQNGYG